MKLYPSSCVQKLEFDKIRRELSRFCKGPLSKELALALDPETNPEWIEREHQRVREFTQIIQTGSWFPNEPHVSIRQALMMLRIPGAVLAAEDFLSIKKAAQAILNIQQFFKNNEDLYLQLEKIVKTTSYEKNIIKEIDTIFDDKGIIKDNATPQLLQIRISLTKSRQELQRAFVRILRELAKEGVLTENEQSFRNGRKVLSVFAEHKRKIKGIIHGESESGKTTFIEPQQTVELNNEIFELEREEEREIYRILKELTASMSVYQPLIVQYQDIIMEYDFLEGKARFGLYIQGSFPQLQKEPGLKWVKAKHPILLMHLMPEKKDVIPLNIELNGKNRILVISGPNAGGKTICLKTIALLQIMIQSGLPVPCSEMSRVGIFKKVFIDIGDSQSIENELSTYSSHLKSMKDFLEEADNRTLFFIDEFGTGSDPALGGAFAEVILEELAKRRSFGVVTTHYLNLKVMAGNTEGILNGAMAFDEKKLEPLFVLETGRPGSSYTFDIAKRSGLPQHLIVRAKTLVDKQHFILDDLLSKTEQLKLSLEFQKQQISQELNRNRQINQNKEQALEQLKLKQKEKEHEKVKLQQKETQFIRKAEKELSALLKEWQKAKSEEDRKRVAEKTAQRIQQVQQEAPKVSEPVKRELPYVEVGGTLQSGDLVWIRSFEKPGTVEELKGNKVIVISGDLKLALHVSDIVKVKRK